MLLIIVLGLMAKLMSVSGDCDIGTRLVNDFDWEKFSGPRPWYGIFHKSNDFENNLKCSVVTFASPVGNSSLVTTKVHDIRKQRHMINYGNATNWSSNGYYDVSHPVSQWTGRFYVIAIDYDRYAIIKTCLSKSKEASVYVLFRLSHPDIATVEEVKNVMQGNNLDVSQLLKWSADQC